MGTHDRTELFDDWAASYDDTVAQSHGFPFTGYDAVLATVVAAAGAGQGTTVLDLGCGTGMLTRLVVDQGSVVLGTDFSSRMIAQARVAVPEATNIELDLLGNWAALDGRRFSRIVSTYVLLECDLRAKVQILQTLARDHLVAGGRIVIGDLAFATTRQMEHERSRSGADWDPAEHYWVAPRRWRRWPLPASTVRFKRYRLAPASLS
ncbi:MAG: class I SAM-dependent methyltransferase [Chloroflexia bacterium]|nr:class I SAM-dependent methyltransferase [Chloroflexia bacterium]MDQ3412952.1 class I SAM-dependent methyltransferase [Chloroflexota bacterium]